MFLLVSGHHVGAHPHGHQHGVAIQISINLGKKFFRIQLFRQRLSHKSVKAYATMPIGIMGSKSLALLY